MVTKKSRARLACGPQAEESRSARGSWKPAFSAFTQRGFAETSTLEIATRARASKRELYSRIRQQAATCWSPASGGGRSGSSCRSICLNISDRATLQRALVTFGAQLLREVSDPSVVAVFRLAISEAFRAPEVAHVLNDVAFATSRGALREIMRRATAAGLLEGEPADMAEQFFGLLWGSNMLGLLLNIAERPGAREIAARAEKAASAFLLAHPAPGLDT